MPAEDTNLNQSDMGTSSNSCRLSKCSVTFTGGPRSSRDSSRLETERVISQPFRKTIKPIEIAEQCRDETTHLDDGASLGQSSETKDGLS